MEGVMMRGQKAFAVAVRAPDGRVVLHSEPLTNPLYTSTWAQWPLLRGLTLLWDALGLGTRALMWSANIAVADEKDGGAPVKFEGPAAWTTVAVSLLAAIGLFFVLPTFLVGLLDAQIQSDFLHNVIEGIVRLLILVGYIAAVGRVPEIARVFQYHGAEHKTINAYEAGADLTPEAVQKHSLLHPRCGTGFLLIVVVISIFVFALLGRPPMLIRLLSRIVLVPVIATFSYEFIRFGAAHYGNPLMRALLSPSLALQKLTTRPPDDGMVAVAIVALRNVLVAEGLLPAETVPAAEPVTVTAD